MSIKTNFNSRQQWIIDNVVGKRIVNIGFVGKGQDGEQLHDAIRESNPRSLVIGIDINDKLMSLMDNKKSFIHGSVLGIPLKNNSVDTVILGELIEHFYSIELIMANVKRILKNNGKILITSPNPYEPFRFLKHWLLSNNKTICQKTNIKRYLDFYDQKAFWNPLSIANLLIDSGFEINEITTKGLIIPYINIDQTSRIELNHWPFNRLGSNFCIHATLNKS